MVPGQCPPAIRMLLCRAMSDLTVNTLVAFCKLCLSVYGQSLSVAEQGLGVGLGQHPPGTHQNTALNYWLLQTGYHL